MLKTRIMPTLLYKDTELVKGVKFDSWRKIGSVMQTIKVYNMREVDELVFLDTEATLNETTPDFEFIDEFADECFMPLTIGGGITKTKDIKNLLKVGADKVSINTSAALNPNIIKKGSKKFGSQCIVVSIDVKKLSNGVYKVFTHSGTEKTDKDPVSFAREVEKMGAGEILLTSIDQDGTMKGYDIDITRSVADAVSIPVIASGGAGDYEDMLSILTKGDASAVAAASIFHFTHQTPLEAKIFLKKFGINTRI